MEENGHLNHHHTRSPPRPVEDGPRVSCIFFGHGQLWLDRARGGNSVSDSKALGGWLLPQCFSDALEPIAWITCEGGGFSDMLEWEVEWEGKRQG